MLPSARFERPLRIVLTLCVSAALMAAGAANGQTADRGYAGALTAQTAGCDAQHTACATGCADAGACQKCEKDWLDCKATATNALPNPDVAKQGGRSGGDPLMAIPGWGSNFINLLVTAIREAWNRTSGPVSGAVAVNDALVKAFSTGGYLRNANNQPPSVVPPSSSSSGNPESPICPVQPLKELTDGDALRFESGENLDTSKLNSGMKTALACLKQQVSGVGGTLTVTSAYRPPAYQQHLRDVYDRWEELQNYRGDASCTEARRVVEEEFTSHGLLPSQQPALSSAHSRGEAFDASWTLPNNTSIDSLAARCNLRRPLQSDPVHFIHK